MSIATWICRDEPPKQHRRRLTWWLLREATGPFERWPELLVSTDITLAIVPLGTFNNLALSLKLPVDPDAICDLIEAGLTRRIDVGMADEQHAFFEAAGVGVDADLFPIGEEVKSRRFQGIGRAIRLALAHRQAPVKLQFDRPVFAAYQNSFLGERTSEAAAQTISRADKVQSG